MNTLGALASVNIEIATVVESISWSVCVVVSALVVSSDECCVNSVIGFSVSVLENVVFTVKIAVVLSSCSEEKVSVVN